MQAPCHAIDTGISWSSSFVAHQMRLDYKEKLLVVGNRPHMRGTDLMSDGLSDKLKGTAEEVTGKVQKEGGKLTGNPAEKEKGRDKEMEGHYKKTKGGLKEKAEDLKDKLKGS